jgi:prevent-host-death family protein
MTVIASRDLRNHTADVLRRVQDGDTVTITINGEPVAEIIPVRSVRRAFIPKQELIEILATRQADPQLRDDLAMLAGETTDELGPIR